MTTTSMRAQRLDRAGIPPLFGLETRYLANAKPRLAADAARTYIDRDRSDVARAVGEDDAPLIEGTGTVYDSWYVIGRFFPFREKIAPGAFAKSIGDGADIRSMFNHDIGRLLGRTKADTLEVSETPEALHYRVAINAADPLARSAHAQVLRGDVDGSSIWFEIVAESWTFANDDKGLEMDEVVVTEGKLHETGPVVFPANEAAESSARSLDQMMRGLGVTDDAERREMVIDALLDPERAVETLKRALGVEELPDLRALCHAAGATDETCRCRAAEEAPGTTTTPAAEEAPETRAAEEAPALTAAQLKRRMRGIAARYGLPLDNKEQAS